MKHISSLLKIFLICTLALCLSVPAYATLQSPSFSTDFSSETSIQAMFAQLQLQQAELTKKASEQNIEKVTVLQEQQKEVANAIGELNALKQAKAVTIPSALAAEIAHLLPDHADIANSPMTDSRYELLLNALYDLQSDLGVQTQEVMMDLQDYMGQYNSYIQGAGALNTPQTQQLYRGTMLSDGLGMNFTFALGGAVVGVVVTLLLKRRKKAGDSQ